MNIKEAIGVKVDTDVRTGAKLSHSEIYGRAIEYLGGLNAVAPYVPFPLDVVKKALRRDGNLNNTSRQKWDLASGFRCTLGNCEPLPGVGLWRLYAKHGITVASCADGVCILKEAARRLVDIRR